MTHALDSLKPTERFSDRVGDYQRYRPGYPAALPALIHHLTGLSVAAPVADVGSGTGLLTRVFLEAGHPVFGVEPNAAMRTAAEADLAGYARFSSVNGRAEATALPDCSVRLVTAGQAFHWFEPEAAAEEFRRIAAEEFRRIAASPAWAAMIWNDRPADGTPFLAAYEALVADCPEYSVARRSDNSDADLRTLFGGPFARHELPNAQALTREGLKGRVRSSSYVPAPGVPGHDALMAGFDALFDRFSENGLLTLPYTTQVFIGRLI